MGGETRGRLFVVFARGLGTTLRYSLSFAENPTASVLPEMATHGTSWSFCLEGDG